MLWGVLDIVLVFNLLQFGILEMLIGLEDGWGTKNDCVVFKILRNKMI